MMDTVSRKFLSHREVSAQEAVYRLLSLPLVKGSRQVVFVPTHLPENKTKLLKPMKVIQELDDACRSVISFLHGLYNRSFPW
jgi:hypothetical protein